MEDTDNRFFNKQFWRMTLIAAFSQIIVLCIALLAGAVFTDKIDSLTQLFESVDSTLTNVQTTLDAALGVNPEELAAQANALKESATTVGEGVGDGGSEVIDRVGEAWKKFQSGDDN